MSDVSEVLKAYRGSTGARFLGAAVDEMDRDDLLGLVGYLRAELRKLNWLNEQSRAVAQRYCRIVTDP